MPYRFDAALMPAKFLYRYAREDDFLKNGSRAKWSEPVKSGQFPWAGAPDTNLSRSQTYVAEKTADAGQKIRQGVKYKPRFTGIDGVTYAVLKQEFVASEEHIRSAQILLASESAEACAAKQEAAKVKAKAAEKQAAARAAAEEKRRREADERECKRRAIAPVFAAAQRGAVEIADAALFCYAHNVDVGHVIALRRLLAERDGGVRAGTARVDDMLRAVGLGGESDADAAGPAAAASSSAAGAAAGDGEQLLATDEEALLRAVEGLPPVWREVIERRMARRHFQASVEGAGGADPPVTSAPVTSRALELSKKYLAVLDRRESTRAGATLEELRPAQRAVVAYSCVEKSLGDWSACGSGKTRSAIVGIEVARRKRVLFFVKDSSTITSLQIEGEFEKALGTKVEATRYKLLRDDIEAPCKLAEDACVVRLISVHKLSRRKSWPWLEEVIVSWCDAIVVDEAHAIATRVVNGRGGALEDGSGDAGGAGGSDGDASLSVAAALSQIRSTTISNRAEFFRSCLRKRRDKKKDGDVSLHLMSGTPAERSALQLLSLLELLAPPNTFEELCKPFPKGARLETHQPSLFLLHALAAAYGVRGVLAEGDAPGVVQETDYRLPPSTGLSEASCADKVVATWRRLGRGPLLVYAHREEGVPGAAVPAAASAASAASAVSATDLATRHHGLLEELKARRLKAACFNGSSGEHGLQRFLKDDLDVLVANYVVDTGVDGLQDACHALLLLDVPPNREQLFKRLARPRRNGSVEPSVVVVDATREEEDAGRRRNAQIRAARTRLLYDGVPFYDADAALIEEALADGAVGGDEGEGGEGGEEEGGEESGGREGDGGDLGALQAGAAVPIAGAMGRRDGPPVSLREPVEREERDPLEAIVRDAMRADKDQTEVHIPGPYFVDTVNLASGWFTEFKKLDRHAALTARGQIDTYGFILQHLHGWRLRSRVVFFSQEAPNVALALFDKIVGEWQLGSFGYGLDEVKLVLVSQVDFDKRSCAYATHKSVVVAAKKRKRHQPDAQYS